MRITRVELLELTLAFLEPFIISGGRLDTRRSIVVLLHDELGHTGYGEVAPDELPFYSEETLGSARDLITRVLVARVVGHEFAAPEAVDAALRAGVRGNPFARAGIETAAWDLEAHRRGTGLAQLVAERLGVAAGASFPCGVAIGIPEDRRADTLTQRVAQALEHGYLRVKIKVAPGWDEVAVRAARAGMAGSELPLAPDELVGHARLAHTLKTAVCLDETLRDASVARQIVALDGPKVWNLKVHRVGGLSEAVRICRVALECGAELWAGTMPESGIGSQADIAVAALPMCAYPSDLEPSARWFGRGVDPVKLTMSRDGRMGVPGVSIARLLDVARLRAATKPLS